MEKEVDAGEPSGLVRETLAFCATRNPWVQHANAAALRCRSKPTRGIFDKRVISRAL